MITDIGHPVRAEQSHKTFDTNTQSYILITTLTTIISLCTHLNEVFADGFSVEHGVEGHHLIDGHRLRLHRLGHLVDGGQRKPAAALDIL